MNINNLTIGQAKELASIFSDNSNPANYNGLNSFIGDYVIIRTYSAGCWFGLLAEKSGNEVILQNARRMWRWHAAQSISLSGCAKYGVLHDKSKIVEPVECVWLEAIEIIPCKDVAIESLQGAPHVKAE